jgi:hypothetical protein
MRPAIPIRTGNVLNYGRAFLRRALHLPQNHTEQTVTPSSPRGHPHLPQRHRVPLPPLLLRLRALPSCECRRVTIDRMGQSRGVLDSFGACPMVRHALDHDRMQSFSGSRQDRATPLLDEIRVTIETAQGRALPASALGKTCRYALTLWEKLTRFLEYPTWN